MPTVRGLNIEEFIAYRPAVPSVAISFVTANDRAYDPSLYQQLIPAYRHYAKVLVINADDIQFPVDGCQLFNRQAAAQVRQLPRDYPQYSIVVHCNAGVSRTGSIVKFLHEHFHYSIQGRQKFADNPYITSLLERSLLIHG